MKIQIEEKIRQISPQYTAGIIEAQVQNSPTPDHLWNEIEIRTSEYLTGHDTTTIKQISGIAATRNAYKACGKDPSRYRPSCEQLCRRIIQGKKLYSIDTLVDIGNLMSVVSGYPVAVVDREKVQGETITLGLGTDNEPYEAIGRGKLNIENIPIWRDAAGGFATPTSDSVRTKCTEKTKDILIIINAFDGDLQNLRSSIAQFKTLLERYANCKKFNSAPPYHTVP